MGSTGSPPAATQAWVGSLAGQSTEPALGQATAETKMGYEASGRLVAQPLGALAFLLGLAGTSAACGPEAGFSTARGSWAPCWWVAVTRPSFAWTQWLLPLRYHILLRCVPETLFLWYCGGILLPPATFSLWLSPLSKCKYLLSVTLSLECINNLHYIFL